ncbi:hypothetical protein N7516_003891 [Penicillium verrucosum]|uniref:uncharacterized protein n=1 Tax=Penicillium verrucosum TaxID=60171 RepID=UPI0025457C44|nr:uncharacterized protein N7516_003891 [Penicillium verrucosum]KAJ5943723.1 hypothetical protein N7516_003891 [Penicillium verrucosum]
MQGHRVTQDDDILVRDPAILHDLKNLGDFKLVEGKLHYKSALIDFLTTVVETLSYEEVKQAEAVESIQGLRFLKPDFALAAKEDEYGICKRHSDLQDAIFWARKLEEAGQQISDACAKLLPVSYYQVVMIGMWMDPEDFQKLVHVGLRKLLLPWEENSAEQREYYLWSAESTDPFTVELEDEEDYDDDNDKSA